MLGTVTMLAPLALLRTDETNTSVVPTLESTDQNRSTTDSQTLGGENFSTENWTESDAPAESSSEYTITVKTDEDASDLSPVGLMAVPSFLVALAVFVLLRKRMG